MKYYKELDGVRAIAALMVMACHFFLYASSNDPVFLFLKKISVFGQTGVSLFFVLSGFLISRILLQQKNSPRYFRNFYAKRVLRIFPLYYFFLVLYYFLVPVAVGDPVYPFRDQVYFWTYLQNIARTFQWRSEGPVHFWSLAVEEHFYLVWPLVFYFFATNKLKQIIIGVVIAALVCRIVLLYYGIHVYFFTPTRMDELAIGAFLALMEKEGNFTVKASRGFVRLFAIIVAPTIILWLFVTGQGNNFIQAIKYILQSLTYFAFIGWIITVKADHPVRKLFTTKIFAFTGMISYGLYVYHPMCFLLFNRFLLTDSVVVNFFASFAVAYAVATASYYALERPFLRLKKDFA